MFYCDPPYVPSSRGDSKAYAYEMTDEDHRELAHQLHNVKGKVAISGYQGALMDELYGDWQPIVEPSKHCHSIKQPRTEVLWVNYKVGEAELWQVQQTFLEQPLITQKFNCISLVTRPAGIEPAANRLEGGCSIH